MNLEEVRQLHSRALSLVDTVLLQLEGKDELSEKEAKTLEAVDKIIRAAIELKMNEIPDRAEAKMSDAELEQGFE